MALNPQLSSEVSPIGYQATPSGLTTGLNLLGDVIGSMKSTTAKAPSTIDERAAVAWEEFAQINDSLSTEDDKGNRVPIRLGDAPMESLLAFEKNYPQFSNWARDTYKTQRLSPDPEVAAGQEAVITAAATKEAAWNTSLDFNTAASVAQTQFPNDTKKQETYMMDARSAWDIKQRTLADTAEALKGEQDAKTLSDLTWGKLSSSLTPRINFANGGLLEIYRNIQRSPNSSFDLAQEAPQLLTMMPELSGYTVINRNNIESFSQALKTGLIGMTKREMQDAGINAYDPPTDWSKTNFAILDDTIEDINAGVSPEALVKNQQDIGAMNLMQLMQETGNDGIFVLGKMFPNAVGPDQFNELKTIVGAAGTQFTKDALASPDSQISAIEGSSIDGNVKARDFFLGALTGTMPKNTATVTNSFATAALGVFANQSEVATNGGKDQSASLSRLDVGVYNTAIAANPQAILEAANSSPAFKQKFTVSVKQDLSRDIAEVRALATEQGIEVTIDAKGGFNFAYNRAGNKSPLPFPTSPGVGGFGAMPQSAAKEEATIVENFKANNSEMLKQISGKLTAIDLLGEVGSSIKEGLIAPTVQAGGGGSGSEGTSTSTFKLPEEVMADTGFVNAVETLAGDHGIPADDLFRVIEFETARSWSPSAKNPGSSATGLIQFMASTAKGLGTTTEALSKMTREEQMAFVSKYFEPFKGRLKNFGDVYMAVHWPAAVGKGDDYVMYKKGTEAYDKNKNLDSNGDGTVSRGETIASVMSRTGDGKAIGPSDYNAVAAAAGPATQRAVEGYVKPQYSLESPPDIPMPQGEGVVISSASAEMPQEAPASTSGEGSVVAAETPVTMAGRALLAALGGSADKVFKTVEEMDAATDLTPGDVVQVGGEVFVIRPDGSKRKVGDNVLQ